MKKLLLLLLWIALPIQISYGAEAGASLKVGTFMQEGSKPAFGITTGTEVVLLSDAALNTRITNYSGVFKANTSDEIEGATAMSFVRKYFDASSKITLGAGVGTGVLYAIQEGENAVDPAMAFEMTATLFRWISVGVGSAYVYQSGPDNLFPYVTVNLLSPMKK